MAGITKDRQGGKASLQLDGDVPLRDISVHRFIVGAKPAVDQPEPFYSRVVQSLDGSNPQFQVGVDRIFYEDGNIDPSQGIRDLLYRKRVGSRACPNPQHINAVLQRLV